MNFRSLAALFIGLAVTVAAAREPPTENSAAPPRAVADQEPLLKVPGPLETQAGRRGGRTDSPLEAAVAGLWNDAAIGTDPAFGRLFRDHRDQAVAPLDVLEHVGVTDYRDARSDRPPRGENATEVPPTKETREKLLTKIEAQLDAREKLIRENFEDIHTAINTALPLRKFLDSLKDEDR